MILHDNIEHEKFYFNPSFSVRVNCTSMVFVGMVYGVDFSTCCPKTSRDLDRLVLEQLYP